MTTNSNPTDKRREAAEKYADITFDRLCGTLPNAAWVEEVNSFIAGAEYEAKEAEARGFQRAVDLLKTPKAFKKHCSAADSPSCYLLPDEWADWLMEQK